MGSAPGRAGAAAIGLAATLAACGRSHAGESLGIEAGAVVSVPSAVAPGAARPGMVWVAPGVLRAGSEIDEVPRVADSELPGVDVALGGFYIDVLPWPNEAGAIPTTNVTRDEAKRLCEEKGKRLCSELEWERACKGPENARYEYGTAFDPHVCGAGASGPAVALRPSGQRTQCRSAFGVRDLHGSASEWTDSTWGRGNPHDLGVVRGGNDAAGELATRCAFARPLAPTDRSSMTGFRCCVGPHNDAAVELDVKKGGAAFEFTVHPTRRAPPLDALNGAACGPPAAPAPCSVGRAWTWRPAPNVELAVSGGCIGRDPHARCAIGVSRASGDRVDILGQVDTGQAIPEVVSIEGPDRKLRVRGVDAHAYFFRELTFVYGRVDVRSVR
jgi:formylglycine-generating enzyme required for sulfatase activity